MKNESQGMSGLRLLRFLYPNMDTGLVYDCTHDSADRGKYFNQGNIFLDFDRKIVNFPLQCEVFYI